jgi:hypothetical protein
MFLLAVEQTGPFSGGMGEPDSLHDSWAGYFSKNRVPTFRADLRVRAVESVIIAPFPVVRAEAHRLNSGRTQTSEQPQVMQLGCGASRAKASVVGSACIRGWSLGQDDRQEKGCSHRSTSREVAFKRSAEPRRWNGLIVAARLWKLGGSERILVSRY